MKSLMEMSRRNLRVIKQLEQDNDTTPIIVMLYYEAIKSILIALLLKNKLKSDNHECLITFFEHNYPKYVYETQILRELKNIRNAINYQGKAVRPSYLKRNELELKHIIEVLEDLLL